MLAPIPSGLPASLGRGARLNLAVGRMLGFTLLTVSLAGVLVLAWLGLILLTGGSFIECDDGGCGTLGAFSARLGPLIPLAALALAGAAAWAVTRQ